MLHKSGLDVINVDVPVSCLVAISLSLVIAVMKACNCTVVRELVQNFLDVRSLHTLSSVNRTWARWLGEDRVWMRRVLELVFIETERPEMAGYEKYEIAGLFSGLIKQYNSNNNKHDNPAHPGRWKAQCQLAWRLAVESKFSCVATCVDSPTPADVWPEITYLDYWEAARGRYHYTIRDESHHDDLLAHVFVRHHDNEHCVINAKTGVSVTFTSDYQRISMHSILCVVLGWTPFPLPNRLVADTMIKHTLVSGVDDSGGGDIDPVKDVSFSPDLTITRCQLCERRMLPMDVLQGVHVKCKKCRNETHVAVCCTRHSHVMYTCGSFIPGCKGRQRRCKTEAARRMADSKSWKRRREAEQRAREDEERALNAAIDALVASTLTAVVPDRDWKRRKLDEIRA